MDISTHNEIITALEWYIDQGVTDILSDEALDRTIIVKEVTAKPPSTFLGKHDAHGEALKLANSANTLEELQTIISNFDGISIKKTVTNMVFSDGNPKANIMLIGDAPATEDDRIGKAFSGEQGQLLDKILKSIELDRESTYLSNILNWRPPGNRSPTPSEIAISLPFIERHIQLAKPKIIILCGGVAAKSLLGRSESTSRLRKSWHDYMPQTQGLDSKSSKPIPAIVIHSMSALIKNPLQKKVTWEDLLMLQDKITNG